MELDQLLDQLWQHIQAGDCSIDQARRLYGMSLEATKLIMDRRTNDTRLRTLLEANQPQPNWEGFSC